MQLTGIYTYPIKSLGGISLTEAMLTPRGLLYDRRWMLVTPEGRF
ncbi:MAG: MOSC domain-containing protein, partial [Bacteroidetes bacterium]